MAETRSNTPSIILWSVFFAFCAIAIALFGDSGSFRFEGPVGIIRAGLVVAWLAFTGYSLICSRHENLFRTVSKMSELYWGRQIGIDLYISVFLSIGLVYLVTGSIAQTVFWGLAFIPFANQAILLFVILYLDRIVAMGTSV